MQEASPDLETHPECPQRGRANTHTVMIPPISGAPHQYLQPSGLITLDPLFIIMLYKLVCVNRQENIMSYTPNDYFNS